MLIKKKSFDEERNKWVEIYSVCILKNNEKLYISKLCVMRVFCLYKIDGSSLTTKDVPATLWIDNMLASSLTKMPKNIVWRWLYLSINVQLQCYPFIHITLAESWISCMDTRNSSGSKVGPDVSHFYSFCMLLNKSKPCQVSKNVSYEILQDKFTAFIALIKEESSIGRKLAVSSLLME